MNDSSLDTGAATKSERKHDIDAAAAAATNAAAAATAEPISGMSSGAVVGSGTSTPIQGSTTPSSSRRASAGTSIHIGGAEQMLMERLDKLVSSERVKERFLDATLGDQQGLANVANAAAIAAISEEINSSTRASGSSDTVAPVTDAATALDAHDSGSSSAFVSTRKAGAVEASTLKKIEKNGDTMGDGDGGGGSSSGIDGGGGSGNAAAATVTVANTAAATAAANMTFNDVITDGSGAVGDTSVVLDGTLTKSRQFEFREVEGKLVASKMRAPLSNTMKMYSQPKSLANQPVAKWPRGMQMRPHPDFVDEICPEDEMFWERKASDPPAPGQRFGPRNEGRCVFSNPNKHTKWFIRDRCTTYTDDIPPTPYYTLCAPDDPTLIFESRFESGNLMRAAQVDTHEYNLMLSVDLYTNRHTQWFFFSIGNVRRDVTYTFHINNLMKGDSLYNYGMQPVVYSERAAAAEGRGWRRSGFNIKYYRNGSLVPGNPRRQYFTLTFSLRADYADDTLYVAHCYPYTYTMLQNYLTRLSQDPARTAVCRQRLLCKTLAGNMCDLLTVTNFGVPPDEMAVRRGVVITARIHPGESQASHMMRGFIDFITGPSQDAHILRDNFVFKIVPMLNPDGVIVGNYRCSLAGVDLNRTYKHTVRDLYPTVHSCKMMMQRLARDRPVVIYCDLHGHSRKQNVFVYGCDNRMQPHRLLRERVFPMMMSLNGPSKFSYRSSKFSVKKAKESTGRVVTWRELNLLNSLTMEASFCGSTMGVDAGRQFNEDDFAELGPIFFDALLDYCDPDRAKFEHVLTRIRLNTLKKMAAKKAQDNSLEGTAFDLSESESESGGSDSSSSGGDTQAATIRHRLGVQTEEDMALVTQRAAASQAVQNAGRAKSEAQRKLRRRRRKSRSEEAQHAETEEDLERERLSTASRQRRQPSLRAKYAALSNNGIPTFSQDLSRRRERERIAAESAAAMARDLSQNGGGGRRRGSAMSSESDPIEARQERLRARMAQRLYRQPKEDSSTVEADTVTLPLPPIVPSLESKPQNAASQASMAQHLAARNQYMDELLEASHSDHSFTLDDPLLQSPASPGSPAAAARRASGLTSPNASPRLSVSSSSRSYNAATGAPPSPLASRKPRGQNAPAPVPSSPARVNMEEDSNLALLQRRIFMDGISEGYDRGLLLNRSQSRSAALVAGATGEERVTSARSRHDRNAGEIAKGDMQAEFRIDDVPSGHDEAALLRANLRNLLRGGLGTSSPVSAESTNDGGGRMSAEVGPSYTQTAVAETLLSLDLPGRDPLNGSRASVSPRPRPVPTTMHIHAETAADVHARTQQPRINSMRTFGMTLEPPSPPKLHRDRDNASSSSTSNKTARPSFTTSASAIPSAIASASSTEIFLRPCTCSSLLQSVALRDVGKLTVGAPLSRSGHESIGVCATCNGRLHERTARQRSAERVREDLRNHRLLHHGVPRSDGHRRNPQL